MKDAAAKPLPAPIAAYMAACARLDAESILATFVPDAVVGDERRSHTGTAEIRAWILEATIGNKAVPAVVGYRVEHNDGSEAASVHLVDAEVSGDFPGSPVNLGFRFTLNEGRIAGLVIS